MYIYIYIYIYINLFLIRLSAESADISYTSFLSDSLSKAKIFPSFPSFSAGNSFLFFNRFWNVRFSDKFLDWKKPIELFFIFIFYHIKISPFYMGRLPLCVDLFLLHSLCALHPHEIWRSISCMSLQFTPAYKVVMKDENWCQNLFFLLVCIFLMYTQILATT